jgi:hypothetical protein
VVGSIGEVKRLVGGSDVQGAVNTAQGDLNRAGIVGGSNS